MRHASTEIQSSHVLSLQSSLMLETPSLTMLCSVLDEYAVPDINTGGVHIVCLPCKDATHSIILSVIDQRDPHNNNTHKGALTADSLSLFTPLQLCSRVVVVPLTDYSTPSVNKALFTPSFLLTRAVLVTTSTHDPSQGVRATLDPFLIHIPQPFPLLHLRHTFDSTFPGLTSRDETTPDAHSRSYPTRRTRHTRSDTTTRPGRSSTLYDPRCAQHASCDNHRRCPGVEEAQVKATAATRSHPSPSYCQTISKG